MTLDCDMAGTIALGHRIGRAIQAGAVITLDGPLGAGKTHLTRAIAEGLDVVDPRLVTSPTFVIVQEYTARLPIFHFDWYRLKSEYEVEDLGFQEYLHRGGVCIIEWASKFPACLPDDVLEIHLEPVDEYVRRYKIHATGPRHRALLESRL